MNVLSERCEDNPFSSHDMIRARCWIHAVLSYFFSVGGEIGPRAPAYVLLCFLFLVNQASGTKVGAAKEQLRF